MKTRDSGMPEESTWQTFFDPDRILSTLGLDQIYGPVIDVGSGYGTFTLAVARHTRHPVVALDIEPDLVNELSRRAAVEQHSQVQARVQDVTHGSLGVDPGSADVVLLFNLLHCEAPLHVLAAAREALRPAGRVGVIHWRSDIPTPRGPALLIRPSPATCRGWLLSAGFQVPQVPVMLPPYHFGMVGIRG